MNTDSKKTETKQCTIPSVIYWLVVQKWLWKKVVFDNGISGRNYHRYDHRILPHVQGMGDNGENGDVNTAIKWQLKQMFRACI
jgi:hypothetical protein